MADLKFCKDCKHAVVAYLPQDFFDKVFRIKNIEAYYCNNPVIPTDASLVTGKLINQRSCHWEREYNRCGKEGILWEPKK